MSKETLSFVTPPPKNYKISSAFSYNFKLALTVENVFNIWQESAEARSAQLIFSDLSTPKGKSEKKSKKGKEDDTEQEPEDEVDEEAVRLETSVYEDIRDKLIARGVPP